MTDIETQGAIGEIDSGVQPATGQALPFHQTALGKQVITGAAAGAAIGTVLPFLTILSGAVLGAGGLVLLKAAQRSS